MNQRDRMSASEFIKRFREEIGQGKHFVFFLGPGCSRSSGIDGVTRKMVAEFIRGKGTREHLGRGYEEKNAGEFYGDVLQMQHGDQWREQQKEECRNIYPAVGYAILATLFTHPLYKRNFSTILTTNFDDLILEAFYRYTTDRPLLVDRDLLTTFVHSERRAQLIIKLHGDRPAPKTAATDPYVIPPGMQKLVRDELQISGLIFIGCSIDDHGIAKMFEDIAIDTEQNVYWIHGKPPGPALYSAFKATFDWVEHDDFDGLMLLILEKLKLNHAVLEIQQFALSQYVTSFLIAAERLSESYKSQSLDDWKRYHAQIKSSGFLHAINGIARNDDDEARIWGEFREMVEGARGRLIDAALKRDFEARKDWTLAESRAQAARQAGMDDARVRTIYEESLKWIDGREGYADLAASYADFLERDTTTIELKKESISWYKRALHAEPNHSRSKKRLAKLQRGSESHPLANNAEEIIPNWTPNDKDDVVLSMHPDAIEAWRRSELPNASALNLQEIIITTPSGDWHKTEPRASSHWTDAERQIREQVDKLERIACRRVHVFAKGPYALGALLGQQLKERVGRVGRDLVIYQFNSDLRIWEDWGPNYRLSPKKREKRFFDYDRDRVPSQNAKHVVIALQISRELSNEEIRRAIAEQGVEQSLAWIDVRPGDGIREHALSDPGSVDQCDPGSVDQCAHEFDALVFETAKKYPKARIHLFYSGPIAILLRAAAKFHLLETAATLYERIAVEGGYVFVPALALRGTPRLLMGVAEKSYGSVSGPMTNNSEDNADLGIVVALHEEFRELLLMCGNYTQHKNEKITAYRFNRGDYRLVAAFVGDMGRAQAGRVAERMIDQWRPKSIVVMGIAAGIHEDLRVGDVYVPSQANEYMQDAKAVPNRKSQTQFVLVPGAPSRRADYALMDAVRNLEFGAPSIYRDFVSTCKEDLEQLLQDRTKREELVAKNLIRSNVAVLADGHVATGEVVGAAKAFTKWIRGNDRNVKALEMESAGVFMSAQEQGTVTRALAIRGISDYGDERKKTLDEIGRGALRKYAMRNAVRLLWALLDANALPR